MERLKAVVKRLPLIGPVAVISSSMLRSGPGPFTVSSWARAWLFLVAPRLAPARTRFCLSSGATIELEWGTSDREVFSQVFCARQYELPDLPGEPAFVLDGGANIGLSAVFFADRYPRARIVAVEPDGRNFALLESNTAGMPRVTAVRAALWPAHEVLYLHDPGVGPWGMRVIRSGAAGEAVETITIGEILSHYRESNGDTLLKLDIEGAEWDVLQSCDEWIGSVSQIVVELHEHLHEDVASALGDATAGFFMGARRGEITAVWRA